MSSNIECSYCFNTFKVIWEDQNMDDDNVKYCPECGSQLNNELQIIDDTENIDYDLFYDEDVDDLN